MPRLAQARTQDAHWTWRSWLERADNTHFGISLLKGDVCQAVMQLRKRDWMRGPRDGGLECCYIKLFATAPWNRSEPPGLIDIPHKAVKPLGRCLMLRAIETSEMLGYEGRLAWCALSGSVSRYRGMFPNLVTTGLDVQEGLDWYEVGAPEARAFKTGMEPFLATRYKIDTGGAL